VCKKTGYALGDLVKKLLVMTTVGLALAACGTVGRAADNIRQGVPGLAAASDEELADLMQNTCDTVNGAGIVTYLNLSATAGFSSEEARIIGLQAAYTYCSENIELFDN
jgi:hypothetical protein